MPPLRRLSLALLLATGLTACGTTDGTTDGGIEEDTVDVVSEGQKLSVSGGESTSATHAKSVAHLFVDDDPTLDVSKSASDNAAAIQQRLATTVQAVCPGATVTRTGDTVTVNFGTACVIDPIGTVSGAASVTVTKPTTGTVKVAFTFTAMQVNGRPLDGTFTATTSNNTSFTATCDLTSGSKHLVLTTLTLVLDADGKGVKLDGAGTVDQGEGPKELTLVAVHHRFGQCFADGGVITQSKTTTGRSGRTTTSTQKLTFDAQTPTTGLVTVQIGSAPATQVKLPGYGRCGMTSDGGN